MNTPKIADYTTRKSYQQNYAKANRDAINARKRAWRATNASSRCPECRLSEGHKILCSVGIKRAKEYQDKLATP